uniref:G-protein coupled receptors family 1 profile domain-containing protein n=1 Tax=Hucho hucho TaxID=62062 RepID=A0A4W5PTF9_9TELE
MGHDAFCSKHTSALLQRTAFKVCVLCVLIPIPVFAILGNLLIVASVGCFRNLQTPTNSFIVSLATPDFLVAVLVMPFSLVRSVDSCSTRTRTLPGKSQHGQTQPCQSQPGQIQPGESRLGWGASPSERRTRLQGPWV